MFRLSSEEKHFLLRLAKTSLIAAVSRYPVQEPEEIPPTLQSPGSAFVTLHRHRELRGCVGYVTPAHPLYRVIMEGAAAAALKDVRFLPVLPSELPELEVEISVLSPPWEAAVEEIEIGIHGVMVSHGSVRGLLLPQVAVERNWTHLQFLEETCRKAGLSPAAWRHGAKIEIFTAEVFSERDLI